jgi:arylsulfatase A-like enzyme
MSKTILTLLLLQSCATPLVQAAAPSPAKPNVVIILADDLGYGDVQCYNPQRGKIPTPNIDRLAAQGMRFTDAHSSSGVCSPSRYALLTGRYHWRSRLQAGIVGLWEQPLIAPDRLTLAGLAKAQGYQTAAIGKWHLGWDWPIADGQRALFQKAKGPNDEAAPSEVHLAAWREVFSKPIPGGPTARGFDTYFGTDVPNWPPYCFIENDRTVGLPSEFLPKRFLGGTPHLASQPGPALKGWKLEAILPALAERAGAFIASQAQAGAPFLLYMPLTSPHEPIALTDEWKGRSGLTPYADFVMETDAAVGRVLDALDKAGMTDNTVVFFTSDNGKAPYTGAAELEKLGHYPSGPLRGYKTSVYEGGHREPFIVRWPGVVKPGSVCGQLAHQADVLATLADVFGAKLPASAGEDSFSLLPLLRGADKPVREHAVSCAANGVQGVRKGSWKLICFDKPQLYNLADDLGEAADLAAAQPERVKEMLALREKLISDGRSTPGEPQKNDVAVRRLPAAAAPAAAKPVRARK